MGYERQRKPTFAAAFAAAAALMVIGPVATASVSLRGIMHQWNVERGQAHAMVVGHRPYNATAMRHILEDYMHNAARIDATVTRRTVEAVAFRDGFVRLRKDAETSMADLGERRRMSGDLIRIEHDCDTCHARFR